MQVNWVPASSVPSQAINEFEKGLVCEAITKKSSQYGHETSTILVKDMCSATPPAKKSRIARPIIPYSDG